MPNRLLLAEEDAQTLRVLEVSLRGAGFEVTSVTTGAAAWVAIEHDLPQVILAATNLAALDGFELCARVRAREGGREVAFLLLGNDDSLALRIKSIEAGADDYLLKPPYVQDVVARVRALVQRRDREIFTSSARAAEAFAGQLAELSVVDLLRVIADSRRSGIIHLRGAREAPATIYFRQGQVVDAEVGRLSGVDAISRLFSWAEGAFEVHWKPIRRPDAIGLSTPDLILEGMKRLDERNRLAGGLPDLNGVFEVNFRVLAERLSEIPDEVNAVLRLFDGSRTLAHVVEDCQLPDPEAMAIAIRLRDEGIIHNVSQPGTVDNSGPLVVPPRPAGRAPGADDVTVVRRITSLGTGSGPVQQSFAAATEPQPPASASSADTVVGPIPDAPSPFDEVDGVVSPANHAKTDPGLGQPLALPDLDPSGRSAEETLVETDAVPTARDGHRGSADAAEVTAPNAVHEAPSSSAGQPRPGHAQSPVGSEAQGVPANGGAGLHADPSSLQTQRGLGPFPELFRAESHPTPAGGASLDAPNLAGGAEITRPIELEPPSATEGPAADATAEGAGLAATSGAEAPVAIPEPARSPFGPSDEKSAPATFAEDEISAKEALDELGVPGPRHGLRIIVALAVAGALAAVVVHKLRSGPVAQSSPPAASGPATTPVPAEPPSAATAVDNPAPAPGAADNPSPAAAEPIAENAKGAGPPSAAPTAAPGAEKAVPVEAQPAKAEPARAAGPNARQAAEQRSRAEPAQTEPATLEAAQAAGNGKKPMAPSAVTARPAVAAATEKSAAPEPRAVAALPAAKAAPPVDFTHQLATCRSQFLRDRIREAAATCAAALEANPSSADALTMMAHVELNRGHLGRANELAQKAITIDPNQADAYVIIGGVHQDSGRNAQAKISYRRYLQLAPHGRYADEVRSIVGSL